MKIVADTNVLLRDALHDDPGQARLAAQALRSANLIAIPVAVLCEFVWVLRQGYGKPPAEVSAAIRALLNSDTVVTNSPVVEAGLETLDAGGDFADGVIAHEGAWLRRRGVCQLRQASRQAPQVARQARPASFLNHSRSSRCFSTKSARYTRSSGNSSSASRCLFRRTCGSRNGHSGRTVRRRQGFGSKALAANRQPYGPSKTGVRQQGSYRQQTAQVG